MVDLEQTFRNERRMMEVIRLIGVCGLLLIPILLGFLAVAPTTEDSFRTVGGIVVRAVAVLLLVLLPLLRWCERGDRPAHKWPVPQTLPWRVPPSRERRGRADLVTKRRHRTVDLRHVFQRVRILCGPVYDYSAGRLRRSCRGSRGIGVGPRSLGCC